MYTWGCHNLFAQTVNNEQYRGGSLRFGCMLGEYSCFVCIFALLISTSGLEYWKCGNTNKIRIFVLCYFCTTSLAPWNKVKGFFSKFIVHIKEGCHTLFSHHGFPLAPPNPHQLLNIHCSLHLEQGVTTPTIIHKVGEGKCNPLRAVWPFWWI